jgi:Zn-dependent protease/CBS domain-containing protein
LRGSIPVARLFGISIKVHVTFLLLVVVAAAGGAKVLFLIGAVFFFVTVHELCHSLVAKRFGIKVREITLLPIGGIASMSKMPEKPAQELAIAIAGPASNVAIVLLLFFPAKMLLGPENLFHSLSTSTWPLTIAYAYWINLALAGFNILPAFPMDGGRVLRALLALRIGYRRATRVAVGFGHAFALGFAYYGIIKMNIILIAIAVFIYIAASNEELQSDVKETLKKFRVCDILPRDFASLAPGTTLAKVLETVFHSHQEDFPVVEAGAMCGFITRQDIMKGVHSRGTGSTVRDIMRTKIPRLKETDSLMKAQAVMQASGVRALPVLDGGRVKGVVTLEDIGRVYSLAHAPL